MSKLDELIKELCPNGVEYKKLGELGTIYNGLTGKNKNDFIEGNQKYITYVNVFNNISIDIETQDKVKINRNEKQNKVEYGDVIFTASSENIQDVGMTSVLTNLIEEDLYLNSFCFGFRFSTDIMLPSFSKYLFRSENLRKQIRKTANGVTRYNISKEKIKEILVPILPLKIQEEVARILDDYIKSVEELKEKLNKELIARKKQYSWYRDYLLKFENKVEIVTLGDISEYSKDKIDIKELSSENYIGIENMLQDAKGVIKSSCLLTEGRCTKFFEGDILIGNIRPYLKKIWLSDRVGGANTDVLVIKKSIESIDNKYLFFVLSSEKFFSYVMRSVKAGKMPRGNKEMIMKYQFPLPPLEVQKRIVEVLDNFEKICNDLNIGLPAEIEARQKQYEFYRNFLLTFEEKSRQAILACELA